MYDEDDAFTVDETGCINIGYDGAMILCGRCDGLLGMRSDEIVALDSTVMCQMFIFMNDYRMPEYAPVDEDLSEDDWMPAYARADEEYAENDWMLEHAPMEEE